MYKNLSYSLRWNAIESLFYNGVMLVHQMALFAVLDRAQYGLLGALFGILYLCVHIFNFGLDGFFAFNFSRLSSNRSIWSRYVITQICLLAITFVFLSPLVGIYVYYYFPIERLSVPVLLMCALILEGIKKTFRTILQLALENRTSTLIEVFFLSIYMLIVWSAYAIKIKLSIAFLLGALAFCSLLANVLLVYAVYSWSRFLPSGVPSDSWHFLAICYTRLVFTFNQLVHQVFSTNFLVPLFVHTGGMSYGALFKIVSTVTQFFSIFMQKIVGITAEALFAVYEKAGIDSRKLAFSSVLRSICHMIYGAFIFFCINTKDILLFNGVDLSGTLWLVAFAFFFLYSFETLLVNCEKWFFLQARFNFILLFNFFTVLALLGIFCLSRYIYLSPQFILAMLLIIRVCGFIFLGTYLRNIYNIRALWLPKLNYVFISVAFSLLVKFAIYLVS
jgi:hypothetical protein